MRDRGPASRPQWGEEAAAGRVDASPDEAPARPGGSPSEAPEPRFRRRGRRAARPRRRARLIMAAAVLVPVAFVLMRARGPEAPPTAGARHGGVMRDHGVDSRPWSGEGGAAAGRAEAHAPTDAMSEPRFRRRGRRPGPPRRRARLVLAAAVLVPVAFVLMRARGPEAPPPPPAPPFQRETFLDWMAREDQRRAERNEARFQGWTLRTGQEVDHPNTRQRNRLQRFLDDLGKAFQSLIIH